MIITAGDKKVDLKKAFPLTWGELEDLEEQGVNLILGEPIQGMKQISTLVHFCAHKVDQAVTMDDVRAISATHLLSVFGYVADAAAKMETPKGKRPS